MTSNAKHNFSRIHCIIGCLVALVLPIHSFHVVQGTSLQHINTTKKLTISSFPPRKTITTTLAMTGPSKAESSDSSIIQVIFNCIGSTTSTVVSGMFFVVLAWKRDAIMVFFFIGAICNGVLSKVLKRILRQERPAELDKTDIPLKPGDNGMPSSHAMSLGFIGTFTALILPWTKIPLLSYVMTSLLYRIETNLHSRDQVLVGLVLGSINGAIWKRLCDTMIIDVVSQYFLNEAGVLPWYLLAIPALLGAMVVGSVERRISTWLKKDGKGE